eukprot:sb/3468674/
MGISSNYEELKEKGSIMSDLKRDLMVAWLILTTITAICGNILTLVATIKYNAIKLDAYSVMLIQAMAVADIAYMITVAIPSVPMSLEKAPLFDDNVAFCEFHYYAQFAGPPIVILLSAALAANKLFVLLRPFRNLERRKRWAVLVISLIVLLSGAEIVFAAVASDKTAYFDWRIYSYKRFVLRTLGFEKRSNQILSSSVMTLTSRGTGRHVQRNAVDLKVSDNDTDFEETQCDEPEHGKDIGREDLGDDVMT